MNFVVYDIGRCLNFSNILIETGTSAGDGVSRALSSGYEDVRSVELSERWYRYCVDKFKDDVRVKLYYGRSEILIKDMIEGLERCVIVLDAHPAGPHTAGHDDLMANGNDSEFNQNVILAKECRQIVNSSGGSHLIIIDDQVGIDGALAGILEPYGYRFVFEHNKYMVCVPKSYEY